MSGAYDTKPDRLPPIELAAKLVNANLTDPLCCQAAATIREQHARLDSAVARIAELERAVQWSANFCRATRLSSRPQDYVEAVAEIEKHLRAALSTSPFPAH